MNDKVAINKTTENDLIELEKLYEAAFKEEELFPLVRELLQDHNVHNFSAFKKDILIGHIAFSACNVANSDKTLSLLGPMAVMPEYQRQGIGFSLIENGLTFLKNLGVIKLLVLGDPNFYSRSGFNQETEIHPAYIIPDSWQSAWQSIQLNDSSVSIIDKLNVPTPWQKESLWSE